MLQVMSLIAHTPVYPTYPPQSEHNQLCVDEFHFLKLSTTAAMTYSGQNLVNLSLILVKI